MISNTSNSTAPTVGNSQNNVIDNSNQNNIGSFNNGSASTTTQNQISSKTPNISYQTSYDSLRSPNHSTLTKADEKSNLNNTKTQETQPEGKNSKISFPEIPLPLSKGGDENTLLTNAKSVLLLNPYFTNYDTIVSMGLVFKYLKGKGKEVHLLTYEKPNSIYSEVLSKFGIKEEDILYKLTPIAYTITLHDANDDIEVDFEKVDFNLTFKLYPKIHEIDFSKIRFGKEGALYDLLITFNTPEFNDVGVELANKIEHQYKRYDTLAIGNIVSEKQDQRYTHSKTKKISKEHYSLARFTQIYLEEKGYSLEHYEKKEVLNAIISNSRGISYLQKYLSDESLKKLTEENNINISEQYRKYYYIQDEKDKNLLKSALFNVKVDESKKVIYSFVTNEQLESNSLTEKDLKDLTHIPFNIPSKFRYAVFGYKYQSKIKMIVEGNDGAENYDFFSKYGGYGGKYSGMFIGDSNLSLEQNMSKLLEILPKFEEQNITSTLKSSPPSSNISNKAPTNSQLENDNNQTSHSENLPQENEPLNNLSPKVSDNQSTTKTDVNKSQGSASSYVGEYSDLSTKQELAQDLNNNSLQNSPLTNSSESVPLNNNSYGNNIPNDTKRDPKLNNFYDFAKNKTTNPSNVIEYKYPPFSKVEDDKYTLDENAEPMKSPANGRTSFDTTNPPFDKAF